MLLFDIAFNYSIYLDSITTPSDFKLKMKRQWEKFRGIWRKI